MANDFQFKRGLETNRTSVTPAAGEPLWVTDTDKLYIGDGATAGGNEIGSGGTVHDTPVNGATTTAISSNWAYDHNATHLFYTESNVNETITGDWEWQDNDKVSFGGQADAQFYHNNTNFYTDILKGNWYVRDTTTTRFTFSRTSGDFTATGDVTAYSDLRIKENIWPIQNALDKVCAIRGVTFTRTDLPDKEARHVGLIAQDVEAVLPEAVSESEDGIKTVAYGNTVALLVEAIKELRAEVEELKNAP